PLLPASWRVFGAGPPGHLRRRQRPIPLGRRLRLWLRSPTAARRVQCMICGHQSEYSDYMDVAVRELKAKLSFYLRRAGEGELITVTDRGKPVATRGPLLGTVDLSEAIAEGWVTPAS